MYFPTIAILLLLTNNVTGFTVQPRSSSSSSSRISTTKLPMVEEEGNTTNANLTGSEETLREALKEKAQKLSVDDEVKYPYLREPAEVSEKWSDGNTRYAQSIDVDSLQKEIERAVKPRAYPLFLAEKVAYALEDIATDLVKIGREVQKQFNNNYNYEIEDKYATGGTKERIVVLGSGWGAASFLKEIDTNHFDVTVISPRNYFLFTPMLAGSAVGTVEPRSVTQPIREINRNANFLEATAMEILPNEQEVICQSVVCEGNSCTIEDFSVRYDRLIVTVGAQTATYGIPGVREHCCFLKQVEDSTRIRTAIVNCFERANLPTLTDEERYQALTFAVIGAGPTGIEFASELRDFIEQDGPKYYPKLLKFVSIKIIEASSTILAPFDKSLQQSAIEELLKPSSARLDEKTASMLPPQFKLTELLLESGVKEVTDSTIILNSGDEIPYGLSVWAAGNGPLPITLQLIDALGKKEGSEQAEAQATTRGRLAIDPWLRVLGSDGKILAFGDCSCNPEYQLPATAQVASQQGEYLGKLFDNVDFSPKTNLGNLLPPLRLEGKASLPDLITSFAIGSKNIAAPFQFLNLGILAYTGSGSALAQLQLTPSESARVKGTGKIGFGLWRSVYLSKQVSWRNRFLVMTDWVKSRTFGRDITRLS